MVGNYPNMYPATLQHWDYLVQHPVAVLLNRRKIPLIPKKKLIKRVYCIASSPANREFLEFYIASVPGGALSPRLFNLKIGDRIWLSPKINGKFTYDDAKVPDGANLVLMATGSRLHPLSVC